MSGRFAAAVLLVAACTGDDFDIAPPPPVVVGQTVQLATTTGRTATWESSDPATASITADGELLGVSPGGTNITASGGGHAATALVTIDDGGMVAAAGGRITALGGSVTLDVPAGAVGEPTPITIGAGGTPFDPRVVGRTAIAIAIPTPFATPATLTLAYDAARGPLGLPPGHFHIALGNDDVWTDLAASTDDAAGHATTAISDTGTFAVRQAPPTAPCNAPEARQLDFWLGHWSVRFTGATGPPAHSEITRDAEGCTIDEHYTAGGAVGLSVSFFEPTTARWYQTYIQTGGGRLELQGTLVAGEMILATIPNGSRQSRITWSQATDHVRQLGESTGNGGASWGIDFDGIYTPAP